MAFPLDYYIRRMQPIRPYVETYLKDQDANPFVEHGVVKVEILEVGVSKADERLAFLLT